MRTLYSTVFLGLLSTTSMAYAAEVVKTDEMVIADYRAKVIQASPELKEMRFTIDNDAKIWLTPSVGSNYIPVNVGYSLFLFEKNSEALIQPSALFTLSSKGLISAQNVLNQKIMNSNDVLTRWDTSMLSDGVDKIADAYIFSDPTCGYCKKVEREADDYAKHGIKLHYIPYPRSGLNPNSTAYKDWMLALCAKDDEPVYVRYNKITLNNAASSYTLVEDVEKLNQCKKTIEDGYKLGQKIGLQGTPFFFVRGVVDTDEQLFVPGYVGVNSIQKRFAPVVEKKESMIEKSDVVKKPEQQVKTSK